MNSSSPLHDGKARAMIFMHALGVLPDDQVPVAEAHIASCADCRLEWDRMSPAVKAVSLQEDIVRPPASLWDRVAGRIAADAGLAPIPCVPPANDEPEWDEVAPGISVRILSADRDENRVTMLVRLAPGIHYPSHRHAGLEELYLLDGELHIDEKKLHPGDYIRAEAGTADYRVWSQTGCTCVLLTSATDEIF